MLFRFFGYNYRLFFVDTNEEALSFEVNLGLKVFGYGFSDKLQIFGGLAIKDFGGLQLH